MATVTAESVHNPESEGPIQGFYNKMKNYLPEVENQTIQNLDKKIGNVIGQCDKAVATASTKIRKGVPDVKAIQNYANGLTQKVLNEIQDRLNTLINKYESEEAPKSTAIVVKKPQVQNRVLRLFRKSRKLNTLVAKKLLSEVSRFTNTALHTNYIQLLQNVYGNLTLEARVINNVAKDLIEELAGEQLRALKVSMIKTKDDFIFKVKEVCNPQQLKEYLEEKLKTFKDVTYQIVDSSCLSIRIAKETFIQNYHTIRDVVMESVGYLTDKPVKMIKAAKTSSKQLYDKVLRTYNVQKILATRPMLAPSTEPKAVEAS